MDESPPQRVERGAIEQLGLVRIDDRLIHGQVIAVWCRHQPFTRIIVADDDVASDDFMRTVLRLAAPRELDLDVLTLEESARVLGTDAPDRATTMVLVKSPAAARRLYEGGVRYSTLNVGGIGGGAGKEERLPEYRAVAGGGRNPRASDASRGEGHSSDATR